ncbi:glycosyltransferase family 1 protein [Frankia sp. CN7]|uniref:glycosyltransferase n=1 Tax=Frankia nepalensis TaxID=1836974 RepID=UPI00193422E5|nr:glycosyltransferase [Frankia nepalensis]MBL7497684.1 glycosyltransferase family 1 protein [Frankia nepalensis]
MSKVLVVTFNGGGNVPPALGIAVELSRRGHDVRVLGHAEQRSTFQPAGLRFEAYRRAAAHTPLDRMSLARWAADYVGVFLDAGAGVDLVESLDREEADLVVVDAMLLGALHALQTRRGRVRHVVLHHTLHGFMTRGFAPWVRLLSGQRRLSPTALWARAARALVPGIPALEPRVVRAPNTRLTGPVWPAGVSPVPHSGTGRALVSLSSIFYRGQVETLREIMTAVADLPVEVVLTTGRAVNPAELDVPRNVEAHGFLPHREVLPNVSMVVGHGGFSTTLQALAHDLPMVILPAFTLGDQKAVGAAVARSGAGLTVRRSAPAPVIRDAIARMLDDGSHRAAAARLGSELRAVAGARLGADEIERVLPRPAVTVVPRQQQPTATARRPNRAAFPRPAGAS